ncbi:hypothetical protein FHX52_1938 [Humibacillus xanthopallidus]|uniref:Oligosaccharide repeat unit polymerase n=1 Tax=Humibacillus xanthopallidus TaxID=412689 RepID=A0A543PXL5_9MICO|nr:hypothetical protein [Humibacillus xanthopallidus]TQN48791.1 hypothetical protein FHX52_1938 [Humibacillus xanthopallidus]
MSRRGSIGFWLFTVASVLVASIGVVLVSNALSSPDVDTVIKPALLCVSLVGLNVVTYAVWFNRWNVIAHTQLVFSVVAYVIPIYYLNTLDLLGGPALDLYYRVVSLGFLCCLVGTFVGALLASPARSALIQSRHDFEGPAATIMRRRTYTLLILSIVGILVSFAVMRFIPAASPDPLSAKFFRGAYADAYRPVAPLYRFSTTVITLLLPMAALYAWTRRTFGAVFMLVAAAGVMILGLLREPAFSGILLFIGVLMAWQGSRLPRYFALLIGAYFAGAALYSMLGALGVPGYTGGGIVSGGDIFAQAASGAPDLRDQVGFLNRWSMRPEYTDGKTFFGGLIPGNYPWNPSVWSLHVVNPSQSIESINSGGLRLPAPLWGLVSFGWPGVVIVSFLNGVIGGFLARRFSHLITGAPLVTATCWVVLYAAILDVAPVFFRLSYLSVIQLGVVVWLLRAARVGPSVPPSELPGPPPTVNVMVGERP